MARESLRGSQSCFHLSHNSFAGLIYAVYYRVYTEDGVVPSQSPVYLDDPFADARKAAVQQAKWLVKCLRGGPTCV
jgi:hypothetical protein